MTKSRTKKEVDHFSQTRILTTDKQEVNGRKNPGLGDSWSSRGRRLPYFVEIWLLWEAQQNYLRFDVFFVSVEWSLWLVGSWIVRFSSWITPESPTLCDVIAHSKQLIYRGFFSKQGGFEDSPPKNHKLQCHASYIPEKRTKIAAFWSLNELSRWKYGEAVVLGKTVLCWSLF